MYGSLVPKECPALRVGLYRSGEVPAVKVGNVWFVSQGDLTVAIDAHRQDVLTLKKRTEDFRSELLHGVDGDTIYTEFGGYRRHPTKIPRIRNFMSVITWQVSLRIPAFSQLTAQFNDTR